MPRTALVVETKNGTVRDIVEDLLERARLCKISQARLCALAGLERSTLTRWKRGSCEPNLSSVLAVSRALEMVADIRATPRKAS